MPAPLHPIDSPTTVSAMRNERLRTHAELTELIAGTRRTIAQSQALLLEADAILAKEKLSPLRLVGAPT
jgi:hypothetical protein